MRERGVIAVVATALLALASTGALRAAGPAAAKKPGTAKSSAPAQAAAPVQPADAPKPPADAAKDAAAKEGSAVVEQILKDKEDLITGKRFSYDPGGRRDPFRSLLEQVTRFKGPRPKGIKGMLVAEVDLVGVVRDPKGNIAFFRGSDNKGYFLHVGDEIYDGKLIAIDPGASAVTFRQQVDDPRQIKPYRDIVKRLTPQSEEEAQ